MPTIYDIDFSKFTPRMLPPDKRFTKTVAWVNVLLSPVQYLRDLWFGSYRTGSTAPTWVNTDPYPKYALVKYSNKVIYESLADNNTAVPTDATYWRVAQQNFIGLSERVLYNGQKLVLEYAMNKWFGTTFRQPPNVSDIYITRNAVPVSVFRSGGLEDISSVTYTNTSSDFVVNAYTLVPDANFTIHCPLATYNALASTDAQRDKIFRAFVDLYLPSGITYSITTY